MEALYFSDVCLIDRVAWDRRDTDFSISNHDKCSATEPPPSCI